ncbi:MAG: tRNA (adenosine(37)-N6)-dimethylallyltransferase MiaA [Clostridia bacterium]|nr:tRNA (adenosine(37)-N6)-dimethylallyltransferase MiaA [Clostridia bacterium]
MKKVIFVIGPTASGKTEYSIRLAEALNGEIISADSMQIYKYMDIGSAKPTPQDRLRIKHYLVDEIHPKHPFSVAAYKRLAEKYIEHIWLQGKLPFVCGGTGLYINSLIYDMDFAATVGNIQRREQIMLQIGQGDPQKLHAHLLQLDPKAAAVIHPNNTKRILRAIERLEGGEAELSEFSESRQYTASFKPIMIGLKRDRQALWARINNRVDSLISEGLVAEVHSLIDMGFTQNDIAMKGIGYKEIISCIKNGQPGENAIEIIKANTRRYAKRQMTWFKQYENVEWFTLNEDEFEQDLFNKMLKYIKSEL